MRKQLVGAWIAALPLIAWGANETRTIEVTGVTRTYKVHVPDALPDAPAALVIVMHGGGGNADAIASNTAMGAKSEQEKFIVVFPEGVGRQARALTWNASHCCAYAITSRSADVEFISKMIDAIGQAHRIDPRRVYVTGMSNGGMMSYRVAGALSAKIAAAGIVSGAMFADQPEPSRPVSMIIFHGTADPLVPFDGGTSSNQLVASSMDAPFLAVQSAVDFWRKADGCRGEPEKSVQDNVTELSSDSCREGTAVVLYEIGGGVHAWPGGTRNANARESISATDLIWDFFKAHPKPGRTVADSK